jgi:hypothetical protein
MLHRTMRTQAEAQAVVQTNLIRIQGPGLGLNIYLT